MREAGLKSTLGPSENLRTLLSVNFRISILGGILLSMLYLAVLPFLQGMANLEEQMSVQIMENYVSLLGMILFVPLLTPEQNREIRETIFAKPLAQRKILLLRLALASICLLLLLLVTGGGMLLAGCRFHFGASIAGTFCSGIWLGTIGIFFSCVTGNAVIGYLTSMGYFLMNLFCDLGFFALNGMAQGNPISKLVLLLAAGLLLLFTFGLWGSHLEAQEK